MEHGGGSALPQGIPTLCRQHHVLGTVGLHVLQLGLCGVPERSLHVIRQVVVKSPGDLEDIGAGLLVMSYNSGFLMIVPEEPFKEEGLD